MGARSERGGTELLGRAAPVAKRRRPTSPGSTRRPPFPIGEDGRVRLQGSAAELLATLAREAVLLLGGSQAGRNRRCEADGCAMLFLDTSRSGERRGCSMKRCGNTAKVAEFRRRRRGEPAA